MIDIDRTAMISLDKLKIELQTWHSDKDPKGFKKWHTQLSDVVRSSADGEMLEMFLDEKLGRETRKNITTPTFISGDPDFDEGPTFPLQMPSAPSGAPAPAQAPAPDPRARARDFPLALALAPAPRARARATIATPSTPRQARARVSKFDGD